jgi:hypothetical protein
MTQMAVVGVCDSDPLSVAWTVLACNGTILIILLFLLGLVCNAGTSVYESHFVAITSFNHSKISSSPNTWVRSFLFQLVNCEF